LLLAVGAYLLERLDDLPSQQITELVVTFGGLGEEIFLKKALERLPRRET
jgi:hypothetical protein